MKKTFTLFTLVCILCLYAHGQTEFSKTGTQWIINYSWERFDKGDFHSYTYSLGNDTTLLDETWKILYRDNVPIGAFQENGKKVYYYSYNWPEEIASKKRLIYDFSKEKGDMIYYRELYEFPDGSGFPGYIYESREEALQETDHPGYAQVAGTMYKQGRKVISFGGEDWIEGIGSTSGFFDRYLARATDYSSTTQELHHVISENKTIFIQNQFVDPDYQGTFLKEGKKWYVKEAKANDSFLVYELQSPREVNHFPMYPITCNGRSMGYLYDVNGNICWYEGPFAELNADIPVYDFSLTVGNHYPLYTRYRADFFLPLIVSVENYTVTKVDSIYSNGTPIKRIRLESEERPAMTWLDEIGALSGPLYTFTSNGNYPDWNNEVTCCYLNDEPLYHHPGYKDCTETSIEETTQPSAPFELNGNQLVLPVGQACRLELYRMSGELIDRKELSGGRVTIDLEGLPRLLFGKLTAKNGETVSFKLIR